LPIAGYLKVGEKVTQGGKTFPRSTDYFKATGQYASHFHAVYGERPDRVQVVFISDKYSESCYEEYDARDAQGRKAGYGDGDQWYMWSTKRNDYVLVDFATKERLSIEAKLKWSVTLTLTFLIPKIDGLFALWRFQTKGIHSSIPEIRQTFDNVMSQSGTVKLIPFELIVKKVKSQKPGTNSAFPVVSLVPHMSQDNLLNVRNLLQSGYDLSSMGVLSDAKLKALPQHVEVIQADEYQELLNDLELCDNPAAVKALAAGYTDLPEHIKQKFNEQYRILKGKISPNP
jgi:hypothetical protein